VKTGRAIMSKKIDRRNQLIDIIRAKNGASIKELASLLDVSEMTIRRDLAVLEEDNIVNNVYGAAIFNPDKKIDTMDNYELSTAQTRQDFEKNKIGAFAASLIEPRDIIVIDTGTTTENLAKHIDDTLEATALCYNVNILNYLRAKENLTIFIGGGRYHTRTQMVESAEGISLINSMRFTKAFISAAGVHQNLGVTCAYAYEVPTKKAILKSSVEKILLIDSSKFGKVKTAYFADLSDFDIIITDDSLPTEWREEIERLQIKLYLV
jgi:DeoR family deoxyribose operon repressor